MAALAVTLLIGFAAVLLAVVGWPRIVAEGSLQAIAAWATLATALTTALLALGAVLAAVGVREQLSELRRQNDELGRQRDATARPYLVMRSAHTFGEDWLTAEFENIGSGPALNVLANGRLIEQLADAPDIPEWVTRRLVMDAFESQAPPHFPRGEVHAIRAGGSGAVWFDGNWEPYDRRDGTPYFLAVRVEYFDLFGNRFAGGLDGELWSGISRRASNADG